MHTHHATPSRCTETHPLQFRGSPQPADAGSALLDAVRRQDRRAVASMLQREPGSVRHCDEHGNTALHLAIVPHGDPEIVSLLLARRADPAVTNDDGNTCLHLAFALRPPEPALIDKLLSARWAGDGRGLGAAGMRNAEGRSATALARDTSGRIVSGYEQAVAKADAELAVWMLAASDSLRAAVEADDAVAVSELVRRTGWRLDMPFDETGSLLDFAQQARSSKVAAALVGLVVEQGCTALFDGCDATGLLTPLIAATMDGDVAVMKALLDAGADVNGANVAGATPLHLAAATGNMPCVSLLLARGATVDARKIDGTTPLMEAAMADQEDVVTALCRAGANVDARDKNGLTPLMQAYGMGHLALGGRLIVMGARADAVDYDGSTVQHYMLVGAEERQKRTEVTCTIL